MQNVLEVKNLKKEYDDATHAVDDVSFTVKSGEIVGLLGPNGAGKTTTIHMVLGVLEPTSGSVEILGHDLTKSREKALKQVGFCAAYAHMPGNMTVWQNLKIFGMLYGVPNVNEKVNSLMNEFSLNTFSSTKIGVLSSGEKARTSLAKAMLNNPKLLLLDEPTSSLDPSTAHWIRDSIKQYAAKNNAGILWTSHNMQEVEIMCDRVLFVSRGKIILEGDPKTLPQDHNKKDLEELFIALAHEALSSSDGV